MPSLPSVAGLGWSKIRSLAAEIAATEPVDEIVAAALPLRTASSPTQRQLAVYLLGFTGGRRPDNLARLREQAATDQSWEVQEAIAQAFDAYCAAIGYEAVLPTIDAWLADAHSSVRRNALRDICRRWPELVDAETATWNLADPREEFTYRRVRQAR